MREPLTDWNREWAACAEEAAGKARNELLPEWFNQFLTNVCELPDRNSPDDEPEAVVATPEELRNCAINAIEQCAAPTPIVAADAAAIDAAEFAKLQTFLTEHHADVRPSRPAGLAAWALAALVFERAPAAVAQEAVASGDGSGIALPQCTNTTKVGAPVADWREDIQKVIDSLEPDDWCGDESMIDALNRALSAPQAALTDEQRRALGSAVAALERNGWTDPATVVRALAQAPTERMSDAARDVLAERARQVSEEGWTPEHDDEHDEGEMASAAAAYAAHACGWNDGAVRDLWPPQWHLKWLKPTTPRDDLVKAGALILAEIERIDRAGDDDAAR